MRNAKATFLPNIALMDPQEEIDDLAQEDELVQQIMREHLHQRAFAAELPPGMTRLDDKHVVYDPIFEKKVQRRLQSFRPAPPARKEHKSYLQASKQVKVQDHLPKICTHDVVGAQPSKPFVSTFVDPKRPTFLPVRERARHLSVPTLSALFGLKLRHRAIMHREEAARQKYLAMTRAQARISHELEAKGRRGAIDLGSLGSLPRPKMAKGQMQGIPAFATRHHRRPPGPNEIADLLDALEIRLSKQKSTGLMGRIKSGRIGGLAPVRGVSGHE